VIRSRAHWCSGRKSQTPASKRQKAAQNNPNPIIQMPKNILSQSPHTQPLQF
jgi:hypothetical protein